MLRLSRKLSAEAQGADSPRQFAGTPDVLNVECGVCGRHWHRAASEDCRVMIPVLCKGLWLARRVRGMSESGRRGGCGERCVGVVGLTAAMWGSGEVEMAAPRARVVVECGESWRETCGVRNHYIAMRETEDLSGHRGLSRPAMHFIHLELSYLQHLRPHADTRTRSGP